MEAKAAYLSLFRECFEGRPEGQQHTWFVEGTEGIFDSLSTTPAEKASRKPSPQCSSIAGHAYHIRYILHGANAYIGGPPQVGDWESSWAKQTVTEEEWSRLKTEIKEKYEFFLAWAERNQDWDNPDVVQGVMAQLPHMAYHLGAIRQLMKV